jgi:hypothetical protein
MAIFVIAFTSTRCHINLACMTKDIRAMRYVYLTEGVVFVGLGVLLAPPLGFAGIIIAGIVSNLSCSGLYGLRRTTNYFGVSAVEVLAGWLQAPLRMFLLVLAAAIGLWCVTRRLPALPQFIADCAALGVAGGFFCWQVGLTPSLRAELAGKLSKLRQNFLGVRTAN